MLFNAWIKKCFSLFFAGFLHFRGLVTSKKYGFFLFMVEYNPISHFLFTEFKNINYYNTYAVQCMDQKKFLPIFCKFY